MSAKAHAAYMSGIGVSIVPAWLVGHEYGPWTLYVVAAVALALITASFIIDKRSE
jgi:hypothetical protein